MGVFSNDVVVLIEAMLRHTCQSMLSSVTLAQEVVALVSLHDSSRDTPMVQGGRRAPRAAAKQLPTASPTKKRLAPAADAATIEKDDLAEMADNAHGPKSRKLQDLATLVNRSLRGNFSTWGGHRKWAPT